MIPSHDSRILPAADGHPRSKVIDKSALALPEPRRVRDRDHVKSVAKQPCLICGRRPSDAHHLRFAQSKALGHKVSDEFTVPLCRGHHARSIVAATKPLGGARPASIRSLRHVRYGCKRIPCRDLKAFFGIANAIPRANIRGDENHAKRESESAA
jgi:hypothetical protein